jgi:hypothetical protein
MDLSKSHKSLGGMEQNINSLNYLEPKLIDEKVHYQ